MMESLSTSTRADIGSCNRDACIDESLPQHLELRSSSFVSKTDTLSTKAATEDESSRHCSGSIASDFPDKMEALHESASITSGDSHKSGASPLLLETVSLVKGLNEEDCEPTPKKRLSRKALAEMIARVMIKTMEDTDSQSGYSQSGYKSSDLSLGSRHVPSVDLSIDLSVDSRKLIKLPGPPNNRPLIRKSSGEVCATPPIVPRRRLSNEDIVSLLPEDFKVPKLDENIRNRPRSAKAENDMDVSNHSAPPHIGRSHSASSGSASSEDGERSKISSLSVSRRTTDTLISSASAPSRRIKRAMSERSIRDSRPQMPSRRRCMDEPSLSHIEEKPTQMVKVPAPTSPGHSKSVSNNSGGTPPMGAEEMEAYVMARIPDKVKKKLPSEAWTRIFSVVAETQASNSSGSNSTPMLKGLTDTSNSSVDAKDNLLWLDDVSSVVSGITCPSEVRSMASDSHGDRAAQSKPVSPRKSRNSTRAVMESSALPSSLSTKVRAWGSNSAESAPKIPQRLRRSSAPTYPTSVISREEEPIRYKSESFATSNKKVTFDKVHIRKYERILDINPCTSSGPAVGIGWRHSETEVLEIDDVVEGNSGANAMLLPRHVRERMVRDLGYSNREIADAIRQSLRTKNQRKQTYNNLSAEKVEYLIEKSRRHVSRLLRFRSRKSIVKKPSFQ